MQLIQLQRPSLAINAQMLEGLKQHIQDLQRIYKERSDALADLAVKQFGLPDFEAEHVSTSPDGEIVVRLKPKKP